VHTHTSSRRRLSVGTGTAALSLGLCLCAGQLVATPAASAAATAPVVQAAAATKVKPAVRTTVSTKTVRWGNQVRVTARYFNPSTGKAVTSGTVRLQTWRGGKWINWTSKTVSSSGTVNLYAKPKASAYFRSVYLGNGAYTSHTGAKIYITVKASGAKVLAQAKTHVGALYKYGAAGPKRFDCSGFTKYVYKKAAGKKLPHKANTQQRYGKSIAKSKKQVGDLIVFRSGSYGYHAAIYAGNGYMYDSPHSGAKVSKRKMFSSNYVVRRLV
jgi:cell wall-associated NlpC family hydrolase